MRIIAGRFRGLPLAEVGAGDPAAALRPTSDRVRESLFNLLAHGPYGDPPPPEGGRVLDLFAGSGASARGLSRGATQATFVEQGAAALALLRATSPGSRPRRRPGDRARRDPARANPDLAFDLVFLDPPYGRGLGETALASALAGGWVATGALVAWEESVDRPRPRLDPADRRRYGETMIAIFEGTVPLPSFGDA